MNAAQFEKDYPHHFAQGVYIVGKHKAEQIVKDWPACFSALPFVCPRPLGTLLAELREDARAAILRLIYADTPKHGPTRQQLRHAARKAAKSARA